jgi:hypothetical protein
MRRIFSSPITALVFGLCLRLLFVLRFPASSGDTVLYDQMATNWLKHGVYAMDVAGAVQPVDLRMPGYPAYLAFVYWLTGKTGDAAQSWVLLGQALVDLLGCVAIAGLAALLLPAENRGKKPRAVFVSALWLAALCPFTANYASVPLTEVFAVLLTATALLLFVLLLRSHAASRGIKAPVNLRGLPEMPAWLLVSLPGVLVGLATLFRPESPILLAAGIAVLLWVVVREAGWIASVRTVILMACAFLLPLAPWAIRNYVTLHEVQLLAPKNSNLPGELVPYGFMAWEKTWLFRVKDCYLVPWKLNGEAIQVKDIPERAFDTPEEKQRVAGLLEQYNEDLTLSPEEDAAFGRLARERTSRHPLRTYLWLPLLRGATMWFTPRIELLPVSGHVFPLKPMWQDDAVDQSVTIGLFVLNLFYVALGAWGAVRLWRERPPSRAALALLVLYMTARTAFLTTLETPEPRYVLECFPALIAMGAFVFVPGRSAAPAAQPSTLAAFTGR